MPLDAVGFPDIGAPHLVSPVDGGVTFRYPGVTTDWRIVPQSDGTIAFASQVSGSGWSVMATLNASGILSLPNAGTSAVPTIGVGTEGHGLYRVTSSALGFSVAGSQVANLNSFRLAVNGIFLSLANQDLLLSYGGAATLQLGNLNSNSPVSQTLQAQGSRSGTDNNLGGGNLNVAAGTGTGTGALSCLFLQSPVAAASGTGAQTQTTGATIKNGCVILPVYTVATLPVASTVPYGKAFVSDALAPAFGVVVSGSGAAKTPVWSDGTNWIVG